MKNIITKVFTKRHHLPLEWLWAIGLFLLGLISFVLLGYLVRLVISFI